MSTIQYVLSLTSNYGDRRHSKRDDSLHPPQPLPVLLELVDSLERVDIAVAPRYFKPSRLRNLRRGRLPPLDLGRALSACAASSAGG